jgi:hypothetical protein
MRDPSPGQTRNYQEKPYSQWKVSRVVRWKVGQWPDNKEPIGWDFTWEGWSGAYEKETWKERRVNKIYRAIASQVRSWKGIESLLRTIIARRIDSKRKILERAEGRERGKEVSQTQIWEKF